MLFEELRSVLMHLGSLVMERRRILMGSLTPALMVLVQAFAFRFAHGSCLSCDGAERASTYTAHLCLNFTPELERAHDLECHIASHAAHALSAGLSPRCRGLVERMGDRASDMWRRAADSWYQRDDSAASALAEADNEMDALHASLVAELASGQMALPVTMEMTLVARFYERLGDRAVNIARRVIYLAGPRTGRAPG